MTNLLIGVFFGFVIGYHKAGDFKTKRAAFSWLVRKIMDLIIAIFDFFGSLAGGKK